MVRESQAWTGLGLGAPVVPSGGTERICHTWPVRAISRVCWGLGLPVKGRNSTPRPPEVIVLRREEIISVFAMLQSTEVGKITLHQVGVPMGAVLGTVHRGTCCITVVAWTSSHRISHGPSPDWDRARYPIRLAERLSLFDVIGGSSRTVTTDSRPGDYEWRVPRLSAGDLLLT